MRKIVVTGATSFVAVHLLKRLLDNGDYVYAVVRPNSSNLPRLPKHSNLKIIELDLKNIQHLDQCISEYIGILYHFAWEGIRGEARDNYELQKSNYIATMELIKVAKRLNISIFIGVGSQAEYGNIDGPITEEQIENPGNQYGKFKLKAKQDCESYAKQENIRFIWMRIFSAYGEYDYKNSLIMSCIEKMKKNETILLTECIQKWDFVYVGDIAKVLLMIGIIKCDSGVYNIASGQTRILKEYIHELKEILQSSSELKFGAIPYGPQGMVNIEPIIDKIIRALAWKPEITFDKGINNILYHMTHVDIE